jgi:ribosomal protein S18 acetylase RimI-like enzyme
MTDLECKDVNGVVECKKIGEASLGKGVEFKELVGIDLNTVDQLHSLFPKWKKASVQKKINDTLQGKDKRFVALLDGKIIAHTRISLGKGLHKHRAEITSLVVDSMHRRKGIATGLMNFALKNLPKGKHLVLLAVDSKNKAAIKLYKNIGFEKYGLLKKASQIDGKFVDNYLMKKQL